MGKKYIPGPDAEFHEWLKNFAAKLPLVATEVGLPISFVTAVETAWINWSSGFDAHQEGQNQAQALTETKNELRVDALDVVRTAVNIVQPLPTTTDAHREQLGITVRDTTPTPQAPGYVKDIPPPNLILDWSKRGAILIHFGVNPANEKENAKPDGIRGTKIWYRVNDGAWVWVADDTNSPYLHELDVTGCNKLEYCAQWIDKKMRVGLFSEAHETNVTPSPTA